MNLTLAEKRILVTGATGGIGRAICETLVDSGAQVFGSYHQDEKTAQELSGRGVSMFRANLTSRQEAHRLISQALAEAGSLDALVYAAGNARDHTLGKLADEEWDCVLKLHLEGLVFSVQALMPHLREKKSGKVVAIGSLSGVIGRAGQGNYAAAKAGVIGFIKSLAKEAGRLGVTANVVCPGFIDSKMTRATSAAAWEGARADSALGTLSSAGTVATFTAWLLSDLCEGVTGQVFHLDSRVH